MAGKPRVVPSSGESAAPGPLFEAEVATAPAVAQPRARIGAAPIALVAALVAAGLWGAWVTKSVLGGHDMPAIAKVQLSGIVGEYVQAQARSETPPEQVTTAQAIYSEYKLASGTSVYPGWGPGGEEQGWLDWLIGRSPTPALQLFFADSMIRYWLVKNPAYSSLTFDPQSSTSQAQLAEAAQILDASPDLSGFFARSGKLILIHGDADWAISYRGSVKYFNNVATAVGGAARRDESMEFFLEPGVQHCFGGTGPDSIDLLDAVAGWVEQGRRPSSAGLLLSKQDATGKVAFTRPLCRYPQYPRYKGTGDILAAASYTCTSP